MVEDHASFREVAVSKALGYAVIAGHRFEIDRIWLGRGCEGRGSVLIQFTMRGLQPAIEGSITVFAPDGTGIWQGHVMSFPPLDNDTTWVVEYALMINTVEGTERVARYWVPRP